MAQGNNEKSQVYFATVLYVGTSSTDVTTSFVRRMAALTGDMTARLKSILLSAGSPN